MAEHDPTDRDEEEAIRLQRIVERAELRGPASTPDGSDPARDGGGRTVRCDGCRHYLNPDDPLAYCWHPEVRVLVGSAWSCRHHDPAPEGMA